MSVVGNTCSEIGDVLIIETQLSVLADYVQITSFVDSITGTTGTRFFNKKFRASQDNLVFTDWMDLDNTTIATIEGNVINNIIYFQFQYTRAGTDTTGLLEFNSITINGDIVPCTCSSLTLDNTFLRGLGCGNFITAQLCSNLLKKLYKRGIIPEFIDRGVEIDDEDYIAFWSAICCYFSLFVTYMLKFDTLFMQRDLLIEYLKQRDILVCDNETTLEDLQYISKNYFDEIRKRGTKQIYMRKGQQNLDGSVIQVDGELLRIMCSDECSEFILNYIAVDKLGWCIGNCSPLYKGHFYDIPLTKGYEENIEYVSDFAKYRRFNTSFQTLGFDATLGTATFVLGALFTPMTIGEKTGFGVETMPTFDLDKALTVSANLGYEIEIMVYNINNNGKLSIDFGVDCFDCLNNIYNTEKIDGTGVSNRFLIGHIPNKEDTWLTYKGIIYPYGTTDIAFPDSQLSAGFGTNLRFGSQNINKVIPYLSVNCESLGDGGIAICKFKIRLLNRPYSLGFVQSQNFVEIFTLNNQNKREKEELEYLIQRKLLPYNVNPILNIV